MAKKKVVPVTDNRVPVVLTEAEARAHLVKTVNRDGDHVEVYYTYKGERYSRCVGSPNGMHGTLFTIS